MTEKEYCTQCANKSVDPKKKRCIRCGASEANGWWPSIKRPGVDGHFERDLTRSGEPRKPGMPDDFDQGGKSSHV